MVVPNKAALSPKAFPNRPAVHGQLRPVFSQNLSRPFPEHLQDVPRKSPKCLQTFPRLSQSVSSLFQSVPRLFPVFPKVFPVFFQSFPRLFPNPFSVRQFMNTFAMVANSYCVRLLTDLPETYQRPASGKTFRSHNALVTLSLRFFTCLAQTFPTLSQTRPSSKFPNLLQLFGVISPLF